MNQLQDALDDYLSTRRSVGFKLRETEHMLRDYVAYLDRGRRQPQPQISP